MREALLHRSQQARRQQAREKHGAGQEKRRPTLAAGEGEHEWPGDEPQAEQGGVDPEHAAADGVGRQRVHRGLAEDEHERSRHAEQQAQAEPEPWVDPEREDEHAGGADHEPQPEAAHHAQAANEPADERRHEEDPAAIGGRVDSDHQAVDPGPLQDQRQEGDGEREGHADQGRGQHHRRELAPSRRQRSALRSGAASGRPSTRPARDLARAALLPRRACQDRAAPRLVAVEPEQQACPGPGRPRPARPAPGRRARRSRPSAARPAPDGARRAGRRRRPASRPARGRRHRSRPGSRTGRNRPPWSPGRRTACRRGRRGTAPSAARTRAARPPWPCARCGKDARPGSRAAPRPLLRRGRQAPGPACGSGRDGRRGRCSGGSAR